MGRIVALILAAVLGGNGLIMLFAGLWWYGFLPGVTATGPYNPHFVRDVGAAYLVTAAALAWYAWRPREGRPPLVLACAFLTVHAAIHVFDAVCGTKPLADMARDAGAIYLPVLLTFLLALRRPERVG